jgi:hypothetical protein
MWSKWLLERIYETVPDEMRRWWNLYTPDQRRQTLVRSLESKMASCTQRIEELHAEYEASLLVIEQIRAGPGTTVQKRLRLTAAVNDRNRIQRDIENMTSGLGMMRTKLSNIHSAAILREVKEYITDLLEEIDDGEAEKDSETVREADRINARETRRAERIARPLEDSAARQTDPDVESEVTLLLGAPPPQASVVSPPRRPRDVVRKLKVQT